MASVQTFPSSRHFLRSSPPTKLTSTSPAPPPLPFSPTLGLETTSIPAKGTGRITTPLAAPPPPPLYMSSHEHASGPERQIKYAGADHTLGPTFSEEEDGDDSAFIASKMAALGLDPNGVPYSQGGFAAASNSRGPRDNRSRPSVHAQRQAQAHAQAQAQAHMQQLAQIQQAQQQQALFQLLSHQNGQQQLRDAMALLELQQAQQATVDRQAQNPSRLFMQQQAQLAFLAAQNQPGYERRHVMEQQQFQQQQQQQQQQYLQQLHLQQQLAALQPQALNDQRNAFAAQMQANFQARTNRMAAQNQSSLDDPELRARFESAPTTAATSVSEALVTPPADSTRRFDNPSTVTYPTSPTSSRSDRSSGPTSPLWESPKSSLPLKSIAADTPTPSSIMSPRKGRFAQARQEMEASTSRDIFGALTSSLVKRPSLADRDQPTIAISNVPAAPVEVESATAPEVKPRHTLGLGHGRPSTAAVSLNNKVGNRSATTSSALGGDMKIPLQARSISQPLSNIQVPKSYVVRQPLGPPCEAGELGDKNFQSRMRRQAGLKLGMLGRRKESPLGTPVVV